MSKKIKVLCIVLAMLVIKSFSVSATEDPAINATQGAEKWSNSVEKENINVCDEELTEAVMEGLNDYFLSEEGLVKFLNSKKFTKEQVEQAVEKLEAENPNIWIEQGKKAAEVYLEDHIYTSAALVRKSLYELLFEEGCIDEVIKRLEAENGNIWEEQAEKAASYWMDDGIFSREAIIKKLVEVCEFDKDQAEEAANSLEEDKDIWIKQAGKKINCYLKHIIICSIEDLVKELKLNGFTDDQIVEAISRFRAANPDFEFLNEENNK